ncbi:MAG TPA: hypothetical protein VKV69_05430, partial [Actinomycetota bacterium]|nr:hypothetical protein [Actinomycetota bacterium]
MAKVKNKYWRSLVFILILIAALWGWNVTAHARDVAKVHRDNRKLPADLREPHPGFLTYGLDLRGGLSVVLEPTGPASHDQLTTALEIIRNRVDALGVAEPDISLQGNNIEVQLPGVKDPADALSKIGTTAKLEFRPVLGLVGAGVPTPKGVINPTCGDITTYPQTPDPNSEIIYCYETKDAKGNPTPPSTWTKLLLGPVALQGTDVSDANANLPSGTTATTAAGWEINLSLTSNGAKAFQAITGKLACNPSGDPTRQLAIVLDKVVQSAPQMGDNVTCNQGISGGSAQITGTFTEKEAKDVALVLKYGALPVELRTSTITTVSPTLGREALHSGLLAGAIGLGIVFLYVLIFYRALGLIIWLGLLVHATLTFGVIVFLGRTAGFALSLAGIAGLIVSLGIATDS